MRDSYPEAVCAYREVRDEEVGVHSDRWHNKNCCIWMRAGVCGSDDIDDSTLQG